MSSWKTTARHGSTQYANLGQHILITPSTISEPLATLLGVEKLSRPQIVKQLWNHIKSNNMQNPENKKEIICDDQFRAIFKVDRIDMFKMNKELGQYVCHPLHPIMTQPRLTRPADIYTRRKRPLNPSCLRTDEDVGGPFCNLGICYVSGPALCSCRVFTRPHPGSHSTYYHRSSFITHWHHTGISVMHPMSSGSMGCYQYSHRHGAIGRGGVRGPYCSYTPFARRVHMYSTRPPNCIYYTLGIVYRNHDALLHALCLLTAGSRISCA